MRIKAIYDNAFHSSRKLEELRLHKNLLIFISNKTFIGLSNLKMFKTANKFSAAKNVQSSKKMLSAAEQLFQRSQLLQQPRTFT